MAEFKLGRIKFVWKGDWAAGQTYYVDDVIRYGGRTYICRIGHTSASDFYTDESVVPTKWNQMSDGTDWKGDWAVDTFYKENDIVKYGGLLYICNDSHTSSATAQSGVPGLETATGLEADDTKWTLYSEGFDWKEEWTTTTRYKKNDLVKYGGYTYVCNTAHTSAATVTDGLEVDQLLWDEFNQGIEYKADWTSSFKYKINDVVKYGAGLWICTTAHLSTSVFADDDGNWSQFLEGFEFEEQWNISTVYQPGDIVQYGGNLYIARTNHVGATPSTSGINWSLFTEGFNWSSDWAINTSYRISDVVRVNGTTYLATADSPSVTRTITATNAGTSLFTGSTTGLVAGLAVQFTGTTFGDVFNGATYYIKSVAGPTSFTISTTPGGTTFVPDTATGSMTATIAAHPTNGTFWTRLNSGISWQGLWLDDREYEQGDAVRYGNNAYICILKHRSESDDGSTVSSTGGGAVNSRPDLDTTGIYWNILSVGSETSVLTTRGDMVYYGGSGPTRLPIGKEGQILRAGINDPEWVTLGDTDFKYYVAPHGTDSPAPIFGKTPDKPWKTIRYACEQVEKGPRNPNTQHLLELNRVFIQREVTEWIDYQVANATVGSIWYNFDYDEYKCERDTGFLVDRLIWDLGHGGNLKMRAAAQAYVNALGEGPFSTEDEDLPYTRLSAESDNDVAAFNYMLTLVEKVIANEAPAVNYQTLNGDNSTSTVDQYFNTDLVAEAGSMATITELVGIVTQTLTDQNTDNLVERYSPHNLISIATGRYRETLPIIVPAYTCVQGDELRSTNAGPAGSLVSETDVPYSVAALERFEAVVEDIIVGNTVTESAGNAESQDIAWPYADALQVTKLTQLIRGIGYDIDFRVGTTTKVQLTNPTGYNTSYLIGYGDARALVSANKNFFKEQVKAYLNTNYPNLKYSRTSCLRDVGYIVDAVVYDLTYGGNSQSVVAGLAYYEGVGSSLYINSTEKTATLQAYAYLKTMLQDAALSNPIAVNQVIETQTTGTPGSAGAAAFIGANIDELIDIVDNGPSAATLTDPAATDGVSSTTALIAAYASLNGAVSTIQTNTISYINTTYPDLVYDQAKCSRDVATILKAVGYDFMFNSNFQTLKSAYSYLRATAVEVFSLGQKTATRAALEYVRTQAIASVGGDTTAIARINASMQIIDDIIYIASNEGQVCQTESRTDDYAILQLERNRAFIVAEITAWIAATYPSYTYNVAACERDVNTYIDALKWDLKYASNYKSRLVSRYYANAVKGSLEEDMYYLRDGTGVRDMTLEGLSGDLLPENAYGTSRVSAGAYASLDPGWGPDDFRTWIITRSPYVQGVTTIGNAAIGQKIDGSLHNGGNDSIVSNDFTQVISDGIGAWVTNNGRAELVSVFTYYAHIGYLSENGGRIRGTNGNNSYGDFGSVAEGVDDRETPNTGVVDNRFQFEATVDEVLTNGSALLRFEFGNAGIDYTKMNWTVTGGGLNASVVQDEFRDDAVYQVRLLDFGDDSSGQFGGDGYITNANTAQGGTSTQITIAATDGETSSAYVGMKIYLDGGTAVGQFGIINTYNSGSKIATVIKESDGTAGWDHVVPGTAIVSPDASTTYIIEPRLLFSAPGFTSTEQTIASGDYSSVVFGETAGTYTPVSGTYSGTGGAGATFQVIRNGWKYIPSLVTGGTGYTRLETITIPGTDLGGLTPDNDLVITITAVNAITGAIVDFDEDGYGVGGRFVAIRSGSAVGATSEDGQTWTPMPTGLPGSGSWSSVAFGTLADGSSTNEVSRFVAVATGSATAAYSEDGITWTASTLPAADDWTSVTFGNGRFVAVSSDNTVTAISFDGETWDTTGTISAGGFIEVTYGKGLFVAIRASSTVVATSPDGVVWTDRSLPNAAWTSVTWGNNKFVAVASDSNSGAYSLDGITWSAMTIGSADGSTVGGYQRVRYGQGVFMATAYQAGVDNYSFVVTSENGIYWTVQGVASSGTINGYKAIAFGNPQRNGYWVTIVRGTGTAAARIRTGARARARAAVAENKIFQIRIVEPGSGYNTAPALTIVDPNNTYEAPTTVRIGSGVLANPTFVNRGSQFATGSAEQDTGDGYADNYQSGGFVAVRRLTQRPVPGSNIVFDGLPDKTFKLVNVLTFLGQNDGSYTAFFQVSPTLTIAEAQEHLTPVTTRIRYSQVRLTGHDFLDIGTGGFADTNYPGAPAQDPIPANETVEGGGGRVFYTSTDQDGNFRVGGLFAIEQSTGVATLNADAFNISGLQELNLGNVTLGGGSATITEFSTDPFFTADSDNVVPTQRAIKAYIASQIGGGGASLNVNSVTAGSIKIDSNQITNITGAAIKMDATFEFKKGVIGVPLAFNYFLTT